MKVFLPLHILLGFVGFFLLNGSSVEKLMLFGCVTIVPLALYTVEDNFSRGFYHKFYFILIGFTPIAGIFAFLSFFSDIGWVQKMSSTVWALYMLGIGLYGLLRFLMRGLKPFNELLISAGLMYFVMGGMWFFLYHWKIQLMDFTSQITLLTSIHFHYSAPILCIFIGLMGRLIDKNIFTKGLYFLSGVSILLSPMGIAVGITYSRFIEWIFVITFAIAILGYVLISFFQIIPKLTHWGGKAGIFVSSLSVIMTIAFAGLYAYGRWTEVELVPIDKMVDYHGMVNAFVFVFLGLVGWSLAKPSPTYDPSMIPLSKIYGKGYIGENFLKDREVLSEENTKGLIDRFSVFNREDFQVKDVDPLIQRFYEDTLSFDLQVSPEWRKGFGLLSKIYKRYSRKIGQLNLPLHETENEMNSQIVKVRDSLDGRPLVRAWVRTYPKSQETMFVALYSFHTNFKRSYWNIALPVPFGTVTGVLGMNTEDREGKKAYRLSSQSIQEPNYLFNEEGVYFTNRYLFIKLPLREEFTIWVEDKKKKELKAIHELYLFGIRVATLKYDIRKTSQ